MVTRRRFITASFQLALGLSLSAYLPPVRGKQLGTAPAAGSLEPNIYLKVLPNNEVHFWVKKAEMGQHVHTALTQIAMDELGADLKQVRVHMADTRSPFSNIFTGASWSIPGHWVPLRQLMANARFLLESAAAQIWQCPKEQCLAIAGEVVHQLGGQRLSFGELVSVARQLSAVDNAPLRPSKDYQYIGTNMGRLDTNQIVTGQAQYAADLSVDNMLCASIVHPPLPGYKLKGWDISRLKADPRLYKQVELVALENALAIVCQHQWPALVAKDKIDVVWESPTDTAVDDVWLQQQMEYALAQPGIVCRQQESVIQSSDAHTFSAEYYLPFVAHVPMEPPVALASVFENRAEVWAPTQTASQAQSEIAQFLNLDADNVVVHTTLIGGGFGRKLKNDFVMDAVRISQKLKRPIKLQWTRENDIKNGFLRPYGKDRVQVALDERGYPSNLDIKAASPSILAKTDHQHFKNGLDWSAVMGLRSIPYHVPNLRLSHQLIDLPQVNLVAWRGTFANHHCFAIESLMDELAYLARQDPLEYRLKLLQADTKVEHFLDSDIEIEHKKLKRVLTKVADMMQWKTRKQASQPGTGLGIACHCYDTHAYAAHIVEVEVAGQNIKVKKVACAFDVGVAINPDGVRAQLEGSIVFGLSSALYNEIHFENGAIRESNFHDHPVLRHHEMPEIDIHLFTDGDTPAGVGECGLPSVSPALTNAIFDASGIRVRSLPVKLV
ncbi:molybdopterin cofactor-binding domain-containing protein [Lacimicrobium sp. SS2-24]|uniref:xanthine dehydrogenase family protein molybdopterin-binding subunit n=1 Tax=Lacimicrobium sp. SS2-24 TaxID=2005569 RepID=UPI000B4B26FA|nr:molybdopterin cofactor-binding domain-containing protein [Lacimicrobium sp. SS2-24]